MPDEGDEDGITGTALAIGGVRSAWRIADGPVGLARISIDLYRIEAT